MEEGGEEFKGLWKLSIKYSISSHKRRFRYFIPSTNKENMITTSIEFSGIEFCI